MANSPNHTLPLPPEQQAIRDKCFHPSGTFVEFPIEDVESSIPARFEKIVRMYPQRVAVKMGDRTLTYDQLNRFANRIARAILEKCGYGSEPVALYFEHGIDAIAAILGVLKTGKFYVALNPTVPFERNSHIVENAEPGLIVTNRSGVEAANRHDPGRIGLIDIETIAETVGADDLQLRLPPETPAILVFTSGSTGIPKGVIEPHRNVLHSLMVMTNSRRITAADKLSLLHSLSFGSSKVQLFSALLNGAALLPFDLRMDGIDQLRQWLDEEGITIYHSPPAAFRQLAQSLADKKQLAKLRMMYLSGVGATRLDLELRQKHFGPHTFLEIGMGSTETNQISLCLAGQNTPLPETGTPAGYPVSGKQVLILDANGRILAPGEIGEIAVRSRYLSAGYWRQPELTAEKFLADPAGGDVRTYLTGDLGRMLPDGFLIHLGRKDFMVKIRGFRVEIGEIEGALLSHPLIKDAGVVARDREPGEKYLVGYVVARQPATLTVSALRAFLHSRLPDYMIPSTFVFLESLPLTNGKLDRHALPEPDHSRPDLEVPYVSPSTEIQQRLSLIWSEVLAVEPIGVHDNFFDLGGHSLLATRILSAVNSAFDVEVSMRHLLDAPTVAELAAQIELLQATEDQGPTRRGPIPCIATQNDLLPLSYAEEGLWLMEQLQPGLSAWNMQSRWRLRGALDIAILQRSLNALIERHETLRTAYRLVNGGPVRVVAPKVVLEIPIIPLEAAVEPDSEIDRIGHQARTQPFDLNLAPLLRASIVRVSEQDHVFIITQHHLITDAWSSRIFHRELFALYDAALQGRPSPLAGLPIQYSDYALWERQWGQEQNALGYWREKLAGCAVAEIPTDRRRPEKRSYRGATEEIQISKEHVGALRALGKEERVTHFMLLVAAFKMLLSRYSRSSDITVGAALAGRYRPELENLLGMFINVLPLRTDLSGEPSFRELLRRVRETCLEAYRLQDMPFDKLVEALNPDRETGRTPFFQVLFDVANLPSSGPEVSGLDIEPLNRSDETARYEVVIRAPEFDDGITIRMDYQTDLFSRSRIVEILEQYKYLIEQVVTNPDLNLGAYSLLTPAGRALLPDPTEPLDASWRGAVHELMAAQAAREPEKVAVKEGQEVWTYGELDRRSNQLARRLLAEGIGRGDVIALSGPTSATLVWALMGALKAGAAFFIVDAAQPTVRLKACLEAVQPKVAIQCGPISEPALNVDEILPASVKSRLILQPLATVREKDYLGDYSSDDPQIDIGADELAYVIFTSGSTGTPKGVRGRHGPLTHFLPWVQQEFEISSNDRFSVLAGLSSNILQREIFTALAIGGTLHIPKANAVESPEELDSWMREEAISVAHLTPALARLMSDSSRQPIEGVRRIFFAGDLLRRQDVKKVRQLMPNATVVNFYNSSESQRAGGYNVISENSKDKEVIPLGRGIPGVQLLVVNNREPLAGVGEVGEIWVRSPHLAAGYLNDDSLTAARFITNPFTQVQGDRIYRTGESGRYLPSGEVEFVSRAENQVSIRGHRVELGEIEAVLKSHAAICDAVVVLEEESQENLIAYGVCNQNSAATENEVKSWLRGQLPRHMIPAAIVFLDSLPRTVNGKVDRKALPILDPGRPQHGETYQAPRNVTEQLVATIWTDMLQLDDVGTDDNFFDLGGHSLMGIKLMARLREQFRGDFPVRWLFEAPTIAELAALIDSAAQGTSKQTNRVSSCLFALTPNRGGENVFFLPGGLGGDREFMLYGRLAHHAADRFTFYGLRPRSADGEVAIEGSVAELAREYLEEITAFQPDGRYLIVGNCLGGIVAYEMARQLEQQGKQVGQLVLMDTACPVKYRKGKRLYRLSPLIEKLKARYYYGPVQYYRERWAFHVKQLAELGSREKLRYVRTLAAEYPPPAVQTMRAQYTSIHAQKSYQNVLRAYQPKPYRGNVSMIVSEVFARREVMLGWEAYVRGKIEVHKMPGDHQAYMREYLEATARQLRECLENVQKSQERQTR